MDEDGLSSLEYIALLEEQLDRKNKEMDQLHEIIRQQMEIIKSLVEKRL